MVRLKKQETVAIEKRVCYSQALRIEGALPHGGATQGCTGVLQEVE